MKLYKTAILAALSVVSANAATITITSGLPSQGITPTLSGASLPSFSVSVGTWNGSVFSSFGPVLSDSGKINGVFTSTDTSFNSALIAVFVGTGSTIETSGTNWVIFTQNAGTSFPSDTAQATGVTFALTLPTVLTVAANGTAENGFVGNNYNFAPIPEPSAALLGLIGVVGLLRRRR